MVSDAPRLAVIVAGQFRLANGLAADLATLGDVPRHVFVSTWRRRGLKRLGWLDAHRVAMLLFEDAACAFPDFLHGNAIALLDYLPAFKAGLDAYEAALPELSAEALAEFGACDLDIEDGDLYLPSDLTGAYGANDERMLYKMLRGLRLARRHGERTGRPYTHALRLRPDLHADFTTCAGLLDGRLYTDWMTQEGTPPVANQIGDNFLLAPFDAFEAIVTEGLQQVRRARLQGDLGSTIHVLLAAKAAERGIEVANFGAATSFRDDRWPADVFLRALDDQVTAAPGDLDAWTLRALVYAHMAMTNADVGAARAWMAQVPDARRGVATALAAAARLCAMTGDMDTAMRLRLDLKAQGANARSHEGVTYLLRMLARFGVADPG